MSTKRRTYTQFCGLARALDHVGERWTMLLVRDLLLGPLRYSDLLAGLPGITTNLLARRLEQMTTAGLIVKQRLPPPAAATVYALTPLGRELEPALLALGKWGWHFMDPSEDRFRRDVSWAVVALKRRYRPGETNWTIQLEPGEKVFQIHVEHGAATIRRGGELPVETWVRGPEGVFPRLFYFGADPDALIASGELAVAGCRATWLHFLTDFGLR